MSTEKRKQINIRIESELYEFLSQYAKENYKTVTGVLRELIANLFKEHKQLQQQPPVVVKGDE